MNVRMISFMSIIAGGSISFGQINVAFTITPASGRSGISKWVYGFNYSSGELSFDQGHGFTFTRMGGNRSTGYNWENNASNAGKDFGPHVSDGWWAGAVDIPHSDQNKPAAVATTIFDRAKNKGAQALITLQMAGYVSADKNGTVSQPAPNSRWCEALPQKGSPFTLTPDLSDGKVYMDEYVNYVVNKYGKAADGGILGYGLDNEPDLWIETHPLIHPGKLRCVECIDRTTALAKAVKAVDAGARVFGFVSFGFDGYLSLHGAPDWAGGEKGAYLWFIDYFLDKMKAASASAGIRLIDVLTLHWYPEARGDNRIIENYANSEKDKLARLQAPRTLWDAGYLETSWITKSFSSFLPLLPKLKKSIDTHFPGIELAITEFQYGGYNDITGAIALTDVLGIFGKYGIYAATHWGTPGNFGSLAYKLYRNYDGGGAAYGDMNIGATMSDKENSSIYASVSLTSNDELHIIALNKSMTQSMNGAFTIIGGTEDYGTASVYAVSGTAASIQKKSNFSLSGNKFSYTLPALSAYHFVLKSSGPLHSLTPINGIRRNTVFVHQPADGRLAVLKLFIYKASRVAVDVFNTKGQRIAAKSSLLDAGNQEIRLEFPAGAAGAHLLNVSIDGERTTMAIVTR